MRNKVLIICITILLLGALILAGCSKTTTTTTNTTTTNTTSPTSTVPTTTTTSEPDKYGGTLRIIGINDCVGVVGIPWQMTPMTSPVIFPTLDRIINFKSDGSIEPCLATDWVVADDGKSITFTLRQDVKFHDGTDFNAEALKWNLEYWRETRQTGTASWTTIEVLDTYTLRINLAMWQSTALSGFGEDYCGPISPTAYQQNGEEWAKTHPVGTGPFKLVSLQTGVGWKYERNDDYWGGKPYLEAIEVQYIPDLNTIKMMLEVGQADIAWWGGSSGMEVKADLEKKGFELLSYELGGSPHVMWPDGANADSPLSNKDVRLAIDYAIDRESIAEAIGYGLFEPTYQLVSEIHPLYNPSLVRSYDPAKARQLLSDAGYESLELTLNMEDGTPMDWAVAVQDNLRQVNINLNINMMATPAAFQLFMTGWQNGFYVSPMSVVPDYQMGFEKWFSQKSIFNKSLLKTDELQGLIESALLARTPEEQFPLDIQCNEYVFNEVICMPTFIGRYGGLGIKASYVMDDNFGMLMPNTWTPAKCWLNNK